MTDCERVKRWLDEDPEHEHSADDEDWWAFLEAHVEQCTHCTVALGQPTFEDFRDYAFFGGPLRVVPRFH